MVHCQAASGRDFLLHCWIISTLLLSLLLPTLAESLPFISNNWNCNPAGSFIANNGKSTEFFALRCAYFSAGVRIGAGIQLTGNAPSLVGNCWYQSGVAA